MPLRGNWSGLQRRLENFQHKINDSLHQALVQSAEYVESVVVGHLKNQDLPWEPLKPAYIQRKLRYKARASRSLSEKILIATGTYFQSITSDIEGIVAFVGVRRGVVREQNGEDVINIAQIHEFGAPSQNIPARPLWSPSFEEAKPEINKIFCEQIQNLIE